jgi:hypothetical protein
VDDLVLEIGGVRVAVTAREAELHARLRARYAAFLTERPADWTVTATVAASVARLGRQARAERTADGSVRFERSDFRGAVDLVARRAEVELMDTEEYSFDTFLRMMLSLVLDESDGLLVHAASLARDGRGYLFPGVSGAGKTTVARVSTDAVLLSDELSIVTRCAAHPRAHGTPFWGELARGGDNRVVPLAGIYFLRQALEHRVHPLPARLAVARLLTTVMSFLREPDVVAAVFRRAAALVDAVPSFELEFRPDDGFWPLIAHV